MPETKTHTNAGKPQCLPKPLPVGAEFGWLLILGPGPMQMLNVFKNGIQKRASTSVCLCRRCGNIKTILNMKIKSGNDRSCGCWRREAGGIRNRTHGHTAGGQRTRIYTIWEGANQRTTNSNNPEFHRYGGRNITMYPEWTGKGGFERFLEFMGPGKEGWTIHRVDNDAGYFPENMVWALPKFQTYHYSRNHVLTVRGVTGCVMELCERFKVNYYRVRGRLYNGWSVEDAFFKPKMRAHPSTP